MRRSPGGCSTVAEQEYTPTEARLRDRVKGSLGEYAHEFGIDGEAAMDEWIDQALADRDNRVRADEHAKLQDRIEELEKNLSYEVEQKIKLADTLRDERAKRPDREQIDRIQFEIDNVHQIHGDACLCGFKSNRSRSRTEHLTALFADAVLSSLALEPEAREEAGPALRLDDDGAHIYWADPVEGCWVAFRRVDCVGEEELPERRLHEHERQPREMVCADERAHSPHTWPHVPSYTCPGVEPEMLKERKSHG